MKINLDKKIFIIYCSTNAADPLNRKIRGGKQSQASPVFWTVRQVRKKPPEHSKKTVRTTCRRTPADREQARAPETEGIT